MRLRTISAALAATFAFGTPAFAQMAFAGDGMFGHSYAEENIDAAATQQRAIAASPDVATTLAARAADGELRTVRIESGRAAASTQASDTRGGLRILRSGD